MEEPSRNPKSNFQGIEISLRCQEQAEKEAKLMLLPLQGRFFDS